MVLPNWGLFRSFQGKVACLRHAVNVGDSFSPHIPSLTGFFWLYSNADFVLSGVYFLKIDGKTVKFVKE